MISSLTIAVVLLALLSLVAIGVALAFKWRTEVRRNLRLQREEIRQRDAHAIAAQLLSAREERGRRARSRSAAPRPQIQNRTRRSSRRVSRRVSPIGRPVQTNEVRRFTTRTEHTAHQQRQQKTPSTPPCPPTGAPPSSPAQPAAPPPTPPKPSAPKPSPPRAGATDDEWQNNDAQPNTQESQGQAEGQFDAWGASDAAQAQNSEGQSGGGWKASDAFAPAQDTQVTTTKATEEAKPGEPQGTW